MPGFRLSARCDVALRDEAAAALGGGRIIWGMLHAGGVLHDAIMLRQTPSQVRAVFAPKHAGAANMLWVSTRICSCYQFCFPQKTSTCKKVWHSMYA